MPILADVRHFLAPALKSRLAPLTGICMISRRLFLTADHAVLMASPLLARSSDRHESGF